jgi:hypothetical protein
MDNSWENSNVLRPSQSEVIPRGQVRGQIGSAFCRTGCSISPRSLVVAWHDLACDSAVHFLTYLWRDGMNSIHELAV